MASANPLRTPTRNTTTRPVAPAWQHSFHLLRLGFALLGLGVVLTVVLLGTQSEVRESAEARLIGWLQQRQAPASASLDVGPPLVLETQQAFETETAAVADRPSTAAIAPVHAVAGDRVNARPIAGAAAKMVADTATGETSLAADPKTLPRAQAKVAYWLSKKYRVAPEPISVLVAEAWEVGKRERIDWTLILAVMAVESSFNPFAQSSVGAQGLMQVMTRIHSDKYESAGGKLAAFDPVTNLRVGVEVLLECIERAGSLEAGLKYYVGAANLASDNGYSKRVLAERTRLKQVAAGRVVS